VKTTPELKAPVVPMPFRGFRQRDYAQKLVDEYRKAGVPSRDVFPQSFSKDDVLSWVKREPSFGRQAVYLDDAATPADLPSYSELLDYERSGLDLIAWTLERSGILADGNNGFYFQTFDSAIRREGDLMEVIDVLAREVGVRGIFLDWPAAVTYYASCMGLK
jgi:glycerophosphoryl diester phosphodiesterase